MSDGFEQTWWDDWRKQDYSWEGLDRRLIETSDSQTLQDYWRTDPKTGELRDDEAMKKAGELVVAPTAFNKTKVWWHVAHVPRAWADASPAKDGWDAARRQKLNDLIVERLVAASKPDQLPAQFEGVVFCRAPFDRQSWPIRMACRRAWFPDFASRQARIDYLLASQALFRGEAHFYKAEFDRGCDFSEAVFLTDALFTLSTFRHMTEFRIARFAGRATFTDSLFPGKADFYGAKFHRIARFNGVLFSATTVGDTRVGFHDALFESLADFRGARFGNISAAMSAFRGALFKDVADFSHCGTAWIPALDNAVLEKRLLLDTPGDEEAENVFRDQILPTAQTNREAALRAIEGGCRVVKTAMGQARNEAMEQRYHRFQLIARRKQNSVAFLEKVFSWGYALLSDYGRSFIRPKLAMAVLLVAFLAIYYPITANLAFDPGCLEHQRCGLGTQADAVTAFNLSASRMFPFGAYEAVGRSFLDAYAPRHPVMAAVVRLLATFQSLMALVMAFLLGLAIRRRFQVN